MLDEWQFDASNLRKLTLSNREKQFVLGTLLGTSSLIFPDNASNPHLQMRESKSKGAEWLRCKAEELKKFSRKKSFTVDKDSFRWNSISDPCWIDFYNLCYKNRKKTITLKWLDQLQDIGITTWFIDKGTINNKNCLIRVSRMDQSSIDCCLEYFKIIELEAKCKMHGGSKVLCFEDQSRAKLLKLISPCFPAFLRR